MCRDVHVTSNVELRNNVRLLLNVELRNYVISRQIVERRVKPAVHYTTFVGRRADCRLNTRNRIVCAYRQQTSAVGPTAFNTSRPDSKNESGRLVLR